MPPTLTEYEEHKMATLTQGAAPNIVSANIYEERSATLITAQVLDISTITASTSISRTYTIVAAGTTPTTGQISLSGVQAGDIIVGVGPATSGSNLTAGVYLLSGVVISASTISLTWLNSNGTVQAPNSAAGPISLLLYRPVNAATKTTFEG